jgi:hypothetical protein
MAKRDKRASDAGQIPPDVLEALRQILGGLPQAALERIPAEMLESIIDGIVAIALRRRTHPETVGLLFGPDPIPVTLEMKKLLKWKKDEERGRPVPHTVKFLDYSGAVSGRETVEIPTRRRAEARRPGAPRKLTIEQYRANLRSYQRKLTDQQRASLLGVSRTVVLKLRHEHEGRRKRSGAKRSGAK